MKTKQYIFAVLICLLSASAIIAAILGQAETQTIENSQNIATIQLDPLPQVEVKEEQPPIAEESPIINEVDLSASSTTENEATTTTE